MSSILEGCLVDTVYCLGVFWDSKVWTAGVWVKKKKCGAWPRGCPDTLQCCARHPDVVLNTLPPKAFARWPVFETITTVRRSTKWWLHFREQYILDPQWPHQDPAESTKSCVFETIRATVGLTASPLTVFHILRSSAVLARIRRRDKKGMWNISGSAAGRHSPVQLRFVVATSCSRILYFTTFNNMEH